MALNVLDLRTLPTGRALRVRRVALGLTQADVATLIGTSPSEVCIAERESDRHMSPAAIARLQARLDAALTQAGRSAPAGA